MRSILPAARRRGRAAEADAPDNAPGAGIDAASQEMSDAAVSRRRLLMCGAAVGAAGTVAAGTVAAGRHDGMLGAPAQTLHGAVPWQEGAADLPPGVSGSGYAFFTSAEAAFIEAA